MAGRLEEKEAETDVGTVTLGGINEWPGRMEKLIDKEILLHKQKKRTQKARPE